MYVRMYLCVCAYVYTYAAKEVLTMRMTITIGIFMLVHLALYSCHGAGVAQLAVALRLGQHLRVGRWHEFLRGAIYRHSTRGT